MQAAAQSKQLSLAELSPAENASLAVPAKLRADCDAAAVAKTTPVTPPVVNKTKNPQAKSIRVVNQV